ncbi:MAG: 3-dehydroquinate synthase [Clostridia bacterium]|nr:3-dehydroquinate synthase [Clostridia bacterium]
MQNIFINSGKETEVLFDADFVLTDDNLFRIYGPMLPKGTVVMKSGEDNKNLRTVDFIVSQMLAKGVKRSGKVVAFGGGVVGDTLGFAASVYMRGVKWSFVPTSLLAMADSSIGGKTGVNVGFVKNAVGSFSMPDTYIETKYLRTLPSREYQSGMGEIVKTSLLNQDMYDFMQGEFDETEAIKRCVKIKSEIVNKDFMDSGARKALNMGHTVGHAIEMLTGLSHGQSVLIGLRLEMLMMRDYIEHDFFYEAQQYLSSYIKHRVSLRAEDVMRIASSDKKNGDGISVMYASRIGEVKEAVITQDEFLRLFKGAL